MTKHRRRWAWPRISRDGFLFLFGVTILIHEVWFTTGPPRESVITAALGLLLSPVFLHHGDHEHDRDDDEELPATGSQPSGSFLSAWRRSR